VSGLVGAKGAGEATTLPVASAIANAIEDAVGVRITELPITPVRCWPHSSARLCWKRGQPEFWQAPLKI